MNLLRSFALAGLVLSSLLTVVSPASAAGKELKLGISAGPYADVSTFAAELARKEGLNVKVIEFSDYNIPNAALAAGDIDFNNYQSKKYLQSQIKARGYDFVELAQGIVVPFGIYSKKVSKLEELPQGARIGIPNDPANGARALLFLEKRGLLKLRAGANETATPLDVVDNPKGFKLIELDAAQLPRSLDDTTASLVNLNYALGAGLDPKKALALEDYVNDFNTVLFVAKRDRKDDPNIRRFIDIYRSPAVKEFVQKHFNGAVGTSW